MSNRESSATGYEKRDVDVATVAIAGVVSLAVLLGAAAAAVPLTRWLAIREARHSPPASRFAASHARTRPPLPRLQSDPRGDLARLRSEEEAVLQTYAWSDKEHGRVRIPIVRAMDLLAERGLPTRPVPPGSTP